MLEMELAKANKNLALASIKEIEDEQSKKTIIADMLNKSRYKKLLLYLNDAGIASGLDDKFFSFCKDNALTIPDYAKTADSEEDL